MHPMNGDVATSAEGGPPSIGLAIMQAALRREQESMRHSTLVQQDAKRKQMRTMEREHMNKPIPGLEPGWALRDAASGARKIVGAGGKTQ